MKMPVLFIGHGSPENIILENDFTRRLSKLGKELPRPKTILVASAHWLTDGTCVTCAERPRTIHDFYGFPEELYRLSYPSPGSPDVARRIAHAPGTPPIRCDAAWGLDHASWAILKHIYPAADIPVIELSLDYSPSNDWHGRTLRSFYDLAKRLGPLRDEGVLIIGSGNIVHNLRLVDMDRMDGAPYDWAVEFDEAAKQALLRRDHQALLDCRNMTRTTALSVPTLDHYLPMVCAIGLQDKDDGLEFLHEGFQNRSISMRCFRIG